VSPDKQRFTIRASASRLDKGLLAIPQKFKGSFPGEKGQIQVLFDDEENVRRLYRIALDRYVRERQEQNARQRLQAAGTDLEAEQVAVDQKAPARAGRRRAVAYCSGLGTQTACERNSGAVERREGVPSGIRILLRELHDGKCQLCSFTFEKRNGEPYFEIHHVDPKIGHHPSNLLVVCANCHAQFEHARLADFTWAGNWLVGVAINGKRISVRQPLVHDSIRRALLGLAIVVGVARIGRLFVR